jgi:lipoprotein-releasing system ATP-binding protein
MSDALRLERIVRRFHQGEARLEVLKGASLELDPGEVVAMVGPSGSGKSTLLQIAGLLERPDEGEVVVAGKPSSELKDSERTRIRREALGFVYQFHHLLPEFSALENVVLPQMIAGRRRNDATERAGSMLEALGLGQRLHHRPARLSGGEQQRVAIARALANRPKVVLADEPTGNLDEVTGLAVFEALSAAVKGTRAAALIATHNPDLAVRADRILRLHDGRIESASASSRKTA